jgi:hypothetical protein
MKRFSIALCFLLVFAAVSFAQVFDFTLVNNTGRTITEVYCAPADDDEWGEDVLGVDVLENGNQVEVSFDAAYEKILLAYGVDKYDLKVVYDNGSNMVWKNLKLADFTMLTLTVKGNTGTASWKM